MVKLEGCSLNNKNMPVFPSLFRLFFRSLALTAHTHLWMDHVCVLFPSSVNITYYFSFLLEYVGDDRKKGHTILDRIV